ncbi:hypothetical protein O6H91_10G084800 [Diphasiastrum complanatum]|uniref:Uncharacterized protein n=10 Tax=Diphasiastrum complanatum TaxID=34168 RepID=A0ACC2CJ37_DIPCM|nr:hypothetical protein O6H91_10G084800 [Diphasiastrum complanatum]KAJ7541995.1 hypothetical protein O6H91_10G084800 [Diphasiastrum complanatum]KAJ7541996.1 hypothetical protein O6H91_10G084800 [Diphasiastrum complanatum]KAJ7541997.1 hypothetical protein O6H91_10G084800 [Diphasiastrum complanatum]KAJ7541998.1 hypothetical protein O6H91_10G084800 [Diphasiastrum complanatum]
MEDTEESGRVHPDCINASNPYHVCVEYCFHQIADAKGKCSKGDFGYERENKRKRDGSVEHEIVKETQLPDLEVEKFAQGRENENEGDEKEDAEGVNSEVYAGLNARQKKLFNLRLKLNAARKANQTAIIAEKKREEAPQETRGISKQKWFEDRQKRIGKHLEVNGLDMSKAYMLDTQEAAEDKYKKWDKKPAPFGWDVFNQKSLYNAYKKRTKHIPYSMEDYAKAKEADTDFYRDGASLQYGKTPDIPEENIDKMVNELEERALNRNGFSRRRKFHEEKDIDAINDRNEHFNRKIERAFGKYTVEIKNNLERGTALPD